MNSLFRINVPFQMHCHISTTNYIQKCIESFANNSDAFDSLPIWLVNICYDIIAMLTFRVTNLYFNQNNSIKILQSKYCNQNISIKIFQSKYFSQNISTKIFQSKYFNHNISLACYEFCTEKDVCTGQRK